MAELTFDNAEFVQALRDYMEATGKEAADVVNKKAVDVCFRAAKETPDADLADLAQYSPAKGLAGAPERKMFHAIATGNSSRGASKLGSAVKGKGNRKIATKIYNSRKRAKGYSKAIWYRIARDFGKKMRGKFNIQHAHGTKAVPGINPTAILEADGLQIQHIDRVMSDALETALFAEAKDMREYIERRLAKIAADHSAR